LRTEDSALADLVAMIGEANRRMRIIRHRLGLDEFPRHYGQYLVDDGRGDLGGNFRPENCSRFGVEVCRGDGVANRLQLAFQDCVGMF
jgi:hypothetical protein